MSSNTDDVLLLCRRVGSSCYNLIPDVLLFHSRRSGRRTVKEIHPIMAAAVDEEVLTCFC
jgi:hypothetical protein